MGQEIHKVDFENRDFTRFKKRLADETRILGEWFKNKVFEQDYSCCGFELEAWLVDKNRNPSPSCVPFLANIPDPNIVPELSLYNFEFNSNPHGINPGLLAQLHSDLNRFWHTAYEASKKVNAEPVSIGILPTLKQSQLNIKNLHPNKRYHALDKQLRQMRQGEDLHLNVEGVETLSVRHENLLIETVSTSLQIHLQLNAKKAVRYYNTGFIIAAPMVAVAANSPYLFGKSLWDETRIPVFEQSVEIHKDNNPYKRNLSRVTFGSGYVKESILELFIENLKYAVLLPELLETNPNELAHLKIHNGTIWRWNRPIIDTNPAGMPHIRLEHRVAAAGTSSVDVIANIAFFLGLMRYYAYCQMPPEVIMPFKDARNNFYKASQYGLHAQVNWKNKQVDIKALILNELIPNAKLGLARLGIAKQDIDFFLLDVIAQRVQSGATGSVWQRNYINKHHKTDRDRFKSLLNTYMANQKLDLPVHQWSV